MDFTLGKFCDIVDAGLDADYNVGGVSDLFEGKLDTPFIVLRHDVDRRPGQALDMARAEAKRGIRASYYFRYVPSSFDEDIIREIAAMGHEVGYHYEDWYAKRYDLAAAKAHFEEQIARLNAIDGVTVGTICMHGSPLSRDNNMTIWDHISFEDYGLKDCIMSQDYSGFAFFTDSGRTFGETSANLRDELGNADLYPDVKTTPDVCQFIRDKRADKIMVSCHPERWTDKPVAWSSQFAKDQAVNMIKRGLRVARAVKGNKKAA